MRLSDYRQTTEEAFYTVWMNGVLQERERIIALLEANKCQCNCERANGDPGFALIKGENK